MNDLFAKLVKMTPDQREGALIALDAISRPMTIREIEAAMVGRGVPRTQRKVLSKAVERWHIVALLGPEDRDGGRAETLAPLERKSASSLETAKPPLFRPRAQQFPEPCPNRSRKHGA